MAYILGIDAGNTKTIALVARPDGAIIGTGRSGCGDIYGALSPQAALAAIEQAALAALTEAGVGSAELVATTASAAGADWPEDFVYLQAALERGGFGKGLQIINDALGALRAGSPDGTGVVIACGTGTATGARSSTGQIWHSSFWQEPQGSIGLAGMALRAVYRAELKIDPPTALTQSALDFFKLSRVEDVLHLLTAREGPRPANLGDLTRILLDLAATGDPTARRIVTSHGAALGDYALVAARQVGIEGTAFTLVLTGGVLRHPSSLLGEAIVERVRTTSPQIRPTASRFEPAVGALLLAVESAGLQVDPLLLDRITETMPPLSFFET
jgi:N-acetylglucosamine kinase-like BadF-type ATPase